MAPGPGATTRCRLARTCLSCLLTVGLPAVASAAASAAGDAALIDAVKAGDASSVRAVLARGRAQVATAERDGTTALHWAAQQDRADLVRLLLDAGADARAANRYGATPLAVACLSAGAPVVSALLDAGADPNTSSGEGQTALMTAARAGKAEVVRLLLARGATVEAKERWRGQTALMWAVAEGHADVVRVLLDAGANAKAKTDKGFTPFLFAVRGGNQALVEAMLAAGADVNETAGEGTTALAIAIVNAHYELAAWLLDRGANPNTDMPGGTALHAATRTRDYEYGTVVRPAAVQTGSLDDLGLIRKLLDKGANPNARIVKPLPRQGAFDNNFLRLLGATPYLLAARAADPVLMRLLLERGADPTITTDDQVTPLMVAAGMGYVQGQSIGAPADRLEAVKVALEHGGDVNATSKTGETAMHGAATGGVNPVVELLVSHGATLDPKDKDGTTPLMIADGTKSNFRRWPQTAELLQRLLAEAGTK